MLQPDATPTPHAPAPAPCAALCPSIHHRPEDPHADRGVAPCDRGRGHVGYHRRAGADGSVTLWNGDARKAARS